MSRGPICGKKQTTVDVPGIKPEGVCVGKEVGARHGARKKREMRRAVPQKGCMLSGLVERWRWVVRTRGVWCMYIFLTNTKKPTTTKVGRAQTRAAAAGAENKKQKRLKMSKLWWASTARRGAKGGGWEWNGVPALR